MESNMIQIGIAAASVLIPLAVDLIKQAQAGDKTLTSEEIAQLRAFVDASHEVIQKLPENAP